MAVWSIVKFSELTTDQKLGADYYHIDKLNVFKRLNETGKYTINKIAKEKKYIAFPRDWKEKIKVYDLTDAIGGFLKGGEFSDSENCPQSAKKIANNGDFIISRLRSYLKEMAYIGENTGTILLSTEFIVLTKKGNESIAWLLPFFISEPIQKILKWSQEGSEHPRFSENIIFNLPIPRTIYNNRKLFIDIVENANKKFESSLSLLSTAESLLLSELGLDKLELPKTKWNIRNYSETEEVERMDGEYFLPKYYALLEQIKKFRTLKLGEIVSYKKGIEVGSNEYIEKGIPFYRVSDLSKEEIGGTDTKYISEELYEKLKNNYEPQQGEILFTKDATPGIAFYLSEKIKGIVSSGILRLKLKENVEPNYLSILLNSIAIEMQIKREGGGSIINHLRPKSAMNLIIPILDKKIQQEISDKVRESHSARKEAKKLLEEAKHKVEEMILEDDEKTV
ncbi:hypothetical protein DRQ33_04485 [bacterium]|nr:MAG: hypothetical protein DRQ33_04485 [bacterium]